jgi:hypothetical protein
VAESPCSIPTTTTTTTTASTATMPFDVAKTIAQKQQGSESKGTITILKEVYSRNGLRGMCITQPLNLPVNLRINRIVLVSTKAGTLA